MTPIEKNVIVIDEQGNRYEATYPRRAKGLVKNGRARFVNENTICLACPPNEINLEDETMSENTNTNITNNTAPEKVTAQVLLQYIDRILADSSYLHEAIAMMEHADDGVGMGIGDMVGEREKTHRQALSLLEKLYNDSNPTLSPEVRKLKDLAKVMESIENPTLREKIFNAG
ncbi:MAG: hypothetical protein IJC25_07195, partial [Clostridia bacterium]|nr:hypothetical protein [Clostridia bacterium]